MQSHHYTVKIHRAHEGGFWAEVPALPGCFTQGETLEDVTALVREAMECHLAALLRRGEPFPVEKPNTRNFVFPVTVRAPRLG